MRIIRSIFILFAVLLVSGLPAMAQTQIYAIGTESNRRADPRASEVDQRVSPYMDSVLYTLASMTGQPTEVGTIEGYTRCTGLDIHPLTGEFFAVCDENGEVDDGPLMPLTRNGIFGPHLLKLDPNTAQPTDVGALDLSRSDFVSDISFRSDGTLFAHLNALENGEAATETNTINANSLAIINTNTANVTILGETGSEDRISAIGFTNTDSLIQCTDNYNFPGRVNMLNQTTGQATFLENLNYPPGFEGFNIIPSKDADTFSGDFFALLFHESDVEEEVVTTNGETEGNFLVNIDAGNNGNVSIIGLISAGDLEQFAALAVLGQPQPLVEVPTLSEYGLITAVVMLLGTAVLVLRRRQIKV